MSKCDRYEEMIARFDDLNDEERREFKMHISECKSCRVLLKAMEKFEGVAMSHLINSPKEGFTGRVMTSIYLSEARGIFSFGLSYVLGLALAGVMVLFGIIVLLRPEIFANSLVWLNNLINYTISVNIEKYLSVLVRFTNVIITNISNNILLINYAIACASLITGFIYIYRVVFSPDYMYSDV